MAVSDSATPAASTPAGDAKPAGTPAADTGKPAEKPAATDTTKPGDPPAKPASTDPPAKPAAKAPEKYALTLPVGGHVDAADLQKIEAMARAADMTNDEAQAWANDRENQITAYAQELLAATKADPVYGGAAFDDTQKHVTRALDAIRPLTGDHKHPRAESFRAFLDKSGAGNHVEVMAFLADLGKQIAEDTPVGGVGGGGGDSKDPAVSLYGAGPQVKS
jgi:hypothetical protein